MKLTRAKWAIITKERPTLFLTECGELSESFDEAELLEYNEVDDRLKTLDEPQKFTNVKVTYSVEV